MANFLIVVDPEAERRTRFLSQVQPLLPPLEGLLTGACSSGDFAAVWAAGPRAPISQAADDEGAAVIWGEAIADAVRPADPGADRQDAATLKRLWSDPDRRPSAFFDGFYAAVVYQPTGELTVGADLLGLYPVYYYGSGDLLLVGSSPELFRYHPGFRQQFNPAGLVGILLTGGLFEGQTLFRDVQRLSPGHLLSWRPGTPPAEIQQYTIPLSSRYFSFPLTAIVDPLDHALDQAVTRQVQSDKTHTLLLSGGLDSRMLAGYLARNGRQFLSLTSGLPTDHESQYAGRVARLLGSEHHVVEVPDHQYLGYADLMARWEHLAGGFSFVTAWGVCPHLRALAPRAIGGHAIDFAIGGAFIQRAYSPSTMTMSFEPYFAYAYVVGFQPQTLKKLLRREVFGDLVDETMARIRQVYESYGELESQRVLCFDLYHRGRYHVGADAWRLSFAAWPILPVLDRGLLEVAAGLPGTAVSERRAQTLLLCLRFPRLAQLPLEGLYLVDRAPQPRLRQQVAWHVADRLAPHLRRLRSLIGAPEIDRNQVGRVGDLDSEGWLSIRRQAERYRDGVSHLFDRQVLDQLLPPPEESVDSWKDGLPLKLLLGLMLFSREHL